MSFNVELAKGREIALTVQIRSSSRSVGSGPDGRRADYSHCFETQGHFRHHFETKSDRKAKRVYASCLAKDPKRLI